ncbi:MAG: hypothetical protein J0M37_12310 [Ignavibacteria bacterium]|nr:hypothetical protein [Ignavibacteria bacterium]
MYKSKTTDYSNTDVLYKKLEPKTGLSKKQLYDKAIYLEKRGLPKGAGIGYIALEHNLSISKYYPHDIIEKIFAKKERESNTANTTNPSRSKKRTINKSSSLTLNVNIDNIIKSINDPILPTNIVSDAKNMANAFILLYIFENSIRNFINLVMSKIYGVNWWDTKINGKHLNSLSKKVTDRKQQENENRYHSKRGAHEIYYTDVIDLYKIIHQYYNDLEKYLKEKKSFIENMIDVINKTRRIVEHNNPISKEDFERIKIHFRDWTKQLTYTKEKLGE